MINALMQLCIIAMFRQVFVFPWIQGFQTVCGQSFACFDECEASVCGSYRLLCRGNEGIGSAHDLGCLHRLEVPPGVSVKHPGGPYTLILWDPHNASDGMKDPSHELQGQKACAGTGPSKSPPSVPAGQPAQHSASQVSRSKTPSLIVRVPFTVINPPPTGFLMNKKNNMINIV